MRTMLLAALLLSGCATTYQDFRLEKVAPDEGVVLGRVRVLYNGQSKNEDCAVCFNSVNGPCQNLTPEGYVFLALPRGESSLRRVACKDSSPQHYNFSGATFAVAEGANFFGDVTIEWKNRGGFKVSSLFGAVGAALDESANDGEARLRASKAGWQEILQAFQRQVGRHGLKGHVSLVKEVP